MCVCVSQALLFVFVWMCVKYMYKWTVSIHIHTKYLPVQIKAEGVPALWKGFLPTWSRMVSHYMLSGVGYILF